MSVSATSELAPALLMLTSPVTGAGDGASSLPSAPSDDLDLPPFPLILDVVRGVCWPPTGCAACVGVGADANRFHNSVLVPFPGVGGGRSRVPLPLFGTLLNGGAAPP